MNTTPTIIDANLPIVCRASLSPTSEMRGRGNIYSDEPIKKRVNVASESMIEPEVAEDVATAMTGGHTLIDEINPKMLT